MSEKLDVIIIGGGPAGLTAGIYVKRAGLKCVMLEKMMPGGQISITAEVENYPGIASVSGPELAMAMEEQARGFGLEIKSEEVIEIIPAHKTDLHQVVTTEASYFTKTIIITTGAFPRTLDCPGEKEFTGKGVSYCATCDGAFFRDREVCVVGGGDTAVEEAIFLTKFASKVTLIHRRDKLRAAKIIQKRALEHPKIEFIWNSEVAEIQGSSTVNNLKIKNRQTGEITDYKTDGVFVFVGYLPNSKFLPSILEQDNGGFLITDDNMCTNVPGIFAAGDIRKKILRQVINACGDAATASFAAEKHIEWYFSDEHYD